MALARIKTVAPVVALIFFGFVYYSSTRVAKDVAQSENSAQLSTASTHGVDQIRDAFQNRVSDIMVEASGRVVRMLPDDNEGSRHQKFILRISEDMTLLISHNIDLAERAPVFDGTVVAFRGEYEWNDRGGVVHWTHHDPRGKRQGGWLEVAGRRYR